MSAFPRNPLSQEKGYEMNIREFFNNCQGDLILLDPGTKSPSDFSWTLTDSPIKSYEDVLLYFSLGYNIGYRIPPHIMVIDVDPKNGGLESFGKLPAGAVDAPVTVRTPSGGFHIYTTLPEGVDCKALRTLHKDTYPGIDFLKNGRQVVLPGSTLGENLVYTIGEGAVMPPPVAPPKLIEELTREIRNDTADVPAGYLTNADLIIALQELPVRKYNDNESWLQLLFACHHATAGEGLEAFLDWSISDPDYAHDEHVIRTRWESASIDNSKGSLITIRTLCKEIGKYGAVPSWLRVRAGLTMNPDSMFSPEQAVEKGLTVERYKKEIDECQNHYDLIPGLSTKIASDANLMESHREMLLKRIGKKAGVTYTSILKDIKGLTAPRTQPLPPQESPVDSTVLIDENQTNLRMALSLLDDLTKDCEYVKPLFTLGAWHLWNGTFWSSHLSSADVERKAISVIQNYGIQVTSNLVKNVVDLARMHAEVSPSVLSPDRTEINIFAKNFVLKFDKQSCRWEIHPHHPQNRNQSTIAAMYDQTAPAPRTWISFLEQVMSSKKAIRSLACAMVYAAGGSHPWLRKSFFFYGPPRTGKSTTLDLIEDFLGSENCSALNIQQLGSKNGPAELVGKLANISNETVSKKSFQDDMFKAIVSGESITVEKKFKDPFQYRNIAKCFFAGNGFPRIEDESEAVWDRLVLFSFHHETPTDRADHGLRHKLAAEKSGILSWAMDIFSEEYAKDECTSIMSMDEVGERDTAAWRRINNPALEWARERFSVTYNDRDRVTVSQAYEDYTAWCRREGHYRAAKNHFSRVINKHFDFVKDRKGKAIYTGVVLENLEVFEDLSN
jgi:P4 family phage/plasmid primase-like protien